MVHKKYIRRNGKVFGPYYYETKRVKGKVVTKYVGKVPKNSLIGRKITPIAGVVFLLLVISLVLFGASIFYELKSGMQGPSLSPNANDALVLEHVGKQVVTDSNFVHEASKTSVHVRDSHGGIVAGMDTDHVVTITLDNSARVSGVLIPNGAQVTLIDSKIDIMPLPSGSQSEIPSNEPTIPPAIIDSGTSSGAFNVVVSDINISNSTISNSSNSNLTNSSNVSVSDVRLSPGDELVVDLAGGVGTVIPIDKEATSVSLHYTAPGPTLEESSSGEGKEIKVSGEGQDVLVVADVSGISVKDKSRFKVYWVEQDKFIPFDFEFDGSIIKKLYWNVPHLSNQTFNIIVITKAEHLDEQRQVISDIYDSVKEQDDIWSDTIASNQFVRVTFEKGLTNGNDITIYPRVINGTPSINVFEVNKTTVVAGFDSLKDNEYNKVYLSGLSGSQDMFDLQVVGGEVQFDHIVDPTPFNASQLNVQRGAVTSSALSFSASTTVPFVPSSSFVLISSRGATTSPDALQAVVNFTDSSTIGFHRWNAASASFEWQVIDGGSKISSQRGSLSSARVVAGSASILVELPTAVNTSNSFVIVKSSINSTTLLNTYHQSLWTGHLANSTTINLTRSTAGTTGELEWQVVSINNSVVYNGTNSLTASQFLSVNLPVVVDPARSFLIFSIRSSSGLPVAAVRGDMNSTTLRFYKNSTSAGATVSWFVVTDPAFSVQSGSTLISGAATTVNVAISPVNLTQTFSLVSSATDVSGVTPNLGRFFVTNQLANPTTLQLTRGSSTNFVNVSWFVVSLGVNLSTDFLPISIVAPQNISYAVAPTELNYTVSNSPDSCWYSIDLGVTNNSIVCGVNKTGLVSSQGSNTWIVYANNSAGTFNMSSVTFTVGSPVPVPSVAFASPTPSHGSQTNNTLWVNISSNGTASTYTILSVNRDLLLWTRMDERNSTSDPLDNSSYSNGLRLEGGAVINSSGKFGDAAYFDGIDDVIVSNNVNVWKQSDFTYGQAFSAWVYPQAFSAKSTIIDIEGANSLYLDGSGFVHYFMETDAGNKEIVSLTALPLNRWSHVIGRWSGFVLDLSVNGVAAASSVFNPSFAHIDNYNARTSIGASYNTGTATSVFNGAIDEVIIMNRSLHSDETEAIYNSSVYRYDRDLTSWLSAFWVPGNYTLQAFVVDSSGQKNQTESREVQLTQGGDSWSPVLSFSPPTPPNGSVQVNKDIYVNVSSSDQSMHYSFVDADRDLGFWMRFDDYNGTTYTDLSSWGSNASIQGNAYAYATSPLAYGKWAGFSNGYLETPNNPSLDVQGANISIAFWINPNRITGDEVIIDKTWADGVWASPYYQYGVERVGGYLMFSFADSPTHKTNSYTSSQFLVPYNWYHAAVTYDGTSIRWYINGALDAEEQFVGSISAKGTKLRIGSDTEGGQNLSGYLDEILIFNRTLNLQEVKALYNASAIGNQYSRNFTNLALGMHSFRAHAVDANASRNQTELRNIGIRGPSSVALYLNNTRNNISLTAGDNLLINITNVTGDGVMEVYRDGEFLGSDIMSFSVTEPFASSGFYNITAFQIDSPLYSSSSETWFVNVSGSPFISATLSNNLTDGVVWNITAPPVLDQPAEGNNGTGVTLYWVNVSSNIPASLCLKANGDLVSQGGQILALANEKSGFSLVDPTVPLISVTSLSTSYSTIASNLLGNNLVYFKFYLSAPTGQPAGAYNNTIDFVAAQTSIGCP